MIYIPAQQAGIEHTMGRYDTVISTSFYFFKYRNALNPPPAASLFSAPFNIIADLDSSPSTFSCINTFGWWFRRAS